MAVDFTTPDGSTGAGFWMTDNLTAGAGHLSAVDAVAQEFTTFPSSVGGVQLDVNTDGVREAEACLAKQN